MSQVSTTASSSGRWSADQCCLSFIPGYQERHGPHHHFGVQCWEHVWGNKPHTHVEVSLRKIPNLVRLSSIAAPPWLSERVARTFVKAFWYQKMEKASYMCRHYTTFWVQTSLFCLIRTQNGVFSWASTTEDADYKCYYSQSHRQSIRHFYNEYQYEFSYKHQGNCHRQTLTWTHHHCGCTHMHAHTPRLIPI